MSINIRMSNLWYIHTMENCMPSKRMINCYLNNMAAPQCWAKEHWQSIFTWNSNIGKMHKNSGRADCKGEQGSILGYWEYSIFFISWYIGYVGVHIHKILNHRGALCSFAKLLILVKSHKVLDLYLTYFLRSLRQTWTRTLWLNLTSSRQRFLQHTQCTPKSINYIT